jgi:hypothetical protein
MVKHVLTAAESDSTSQQASEQAGRHESPRVIVDVQVVSFNGKPKAAATSEVHS